MCKLLLQCAKDCKSECRRVAPRAERVCDEPKTPLLTQWVTWDTPSHALQQGLMFRTNSATRFVMIPPPCVGHQAPSSWVSRLLAAKGGILEIGHVKSFVRLHFADRCSMVSPSASSQKQVEESITSSRGDDSPSQLIASNRVCDDLHKLQWSYSNAQSGRVRLHSSRG